MRATASIASLTFDARGAMSAYDMAAISLMSAPAANTFSPPYTTTALISGEAAASAATARSASWTSTLRAFIGGRFSRIVPIPSAISSRTSSLTSASSSTSTLRQRTTGPGVRSVTLTIMAAGDGRRSHEPVIYYRDPSVVVTSHGIEVDGDFTALDELTRVWHRRHSVSARAVAGRGALSLSLLAPIIAAIVAVVVTLRMDLSVGTRVVIVTAALLMGLGTALLLDPVLDRMDKSF